MKTIHSFRTFVQVAVVALISVLAVASTSMAQERFPTDTSMFGYHQGPDYRDSESHPLRIAAYILHPIGWLAQEAIFRPISALAGSSKTMRTITGYRQPFDFRQPSCFNANSATPDCRAYPPFNYGKAEAAAAAQTASVESESSDDGVRQVYFPDVNFNFDSKKLTPLGEGRVHQIARLLEKTPNLRIVLEGHADYKGSDGYNEKLGMNRAEAVREKLVALGVSADRLSTVSFGKSKPIFSEQDAWATAVNRRVSTQVSEVK